MSETFVANTAVATSACTLPLALGIAVYHGVQRIQSSLGELVLELEKPISSEELAGRYIAHARAAEENCLRRLESRGVKLETEAARALARGKALEESLRSVPELGAVAASYATKDIERSVRTLAQAEEELLRHSHASVEQKVREAESRLLEATEAALRRLGETQRTYVADKAEATLRSLGYRVERADGTKETALHAMASGKRLGVVVSSSGQLLVEAAGYEGAGCRPATAAFFRRLRSEGVSVEVQVRHSHGRPEGGVLLGCTAGRGADSMLTSASRLSGNTEEKENDGRDGEAPSRSLACQIWARQRGAIQR